LLQADVKNSDLMGVMYVIVFITAAISLYDFYVSRGWQQTSAQSNDTVFSKRNRRYGAYTMRKTYNQVMTAILGVIVFLFIFFFLIHRGFTGAPYVAERVEIDTVLMALNAPPIDPIETLPPSYKINQDPGVGKTSSASQASPPEPPQPEKTEEQNKENIKNNTGGSVPERLNQLPPEAKTKNKTGVSAAEQAVRDFEKSLFDNADGVKQREKIQQEMDERKRLAEQKKKQTPPPSQASNNNAGGNSGAKGSAMVDWDLKGRTPHENNSYYVRNPGYTCGQGMSGAILVKIKVDNGGDVISATVASDVSRINPCLVEQALKYAKMSRFNPSSMPSQEGTIKYTFVP
jgi:hypothetical protein